VSQHCARCHQLIELDATGRFWGVPVAQPPIGDRAWRIQCTALVIEQDVDGEAVRRTVAVDHHSPIATPSGWRAKGWETFTFQ